MNPLISFVKNAFAHAVLIGSTTLQRHAMPSRKGGRDKSDLPHGYPGAKLARAAAMKRVGVKHLGLRLDVKKG